MTDPKPPDGVFPFFMSNSAAEKCGLKTGPGISDLVESKAFRTADALEEISSLGFMCPFEPCAVQLRECGLEEFVVACDPGGRYGETFLLLHSAESVESHLREREEKERAEAMEREKEERERAEAETAKEARRNAKWVEVPFIPQPYKSATADKTSEEVESLTVLPQRPLITLKVTRPVRLMGRPLNLADRNHDVSGSLDFRSQKIPEFNLERLERDTAVQVGSETSEIATQTPWNRKTDKILQYETQSLNDFGHSVEDKCLASFLRRSLPDIETALQENENVDIFCNALAVKSSDRSCLGGSGDNKEKLRELRNFTDLEYSKGRRLSQIDWHPTNKDIVAISVCDPLSCDDRVERAGLVCPGHIIIWDYRTQIHPHAILRAPLECPVFAFNPTLPDIVVGGCINGQVALWHLSAKSMAKRGFIPPREGSLSSVLSEEKTSGSRSRAPLGLTALSHPEHSHKRMIADLIWLPSEAQINARGQILSKEHLTGKTHQFITVSGDGHALFWDIRFEDILAGKLPHIAKPKPSKQSNHNQKLGNRDESFIDEDICFPSISWAPLFRIKIKRLEGAGELSICQVISPFAHRKGHSSKEDRKSKLICSSEEGELICVDWLPKSAQTDDNEADAITVSPEFVSWMTVDHDRPVIALSQSPFFSDHVVTVSHWNFHIWLCVGESEEMSGTNRPVFSSPNSASRLTGGLWSPTRPGVLFLSKIDGSVDVWDLTDTSYRPSATLSLVPNEITYMQFLPRSTEVDEKEEAQAQQQREWQLLAVGDNVGSLHVFEISKAFSVPHTKEFEEALHFLKDEIKRINTGGTTAIDHTSKSVSEVDLNQPPQQNQAIISTNQGDATMHLTEEEEKAYSLFERDIMEGMGIACETDDVNNS